MLSSLRCSSMREHFKALGILLAVWAALVAIWGGVVAATIPPGLMSDVSRHTQQIGQLEKQVTELQHQVAGLRAGPGLKEAITLGWPVYRYRTGSGWLVMSNSRLLSVEDPDWTGVFERINDGEGTYGLYRSKTAYGWLVLTYHDITFVRGGDW
jgi:hypothetical protein